MALSRPVYLLIVLCLFLMMFGLGATMSTKDIGIVRKKPQGLFVGLGSQFFWMPLVAYLLCVVTGWAGGNSEEKIWAITFILQGCTPGGSTSNLYTYFSNGDLPLSICMTITSTVVALGAMPLLVSLYSKLLDVDSETIDVAGIFRNLILVAFPAFIGIALRVWGSKKAADLGVAVGTKVGFFFIFFIMVVYLIDEDNQRSLSEADWTMFFNVISLGVLGAILGYVTAKFAFGLDPRQCRTIAFETGIQNGPLTLGIVILAFVFNKDYGIDYVECAALCAGTNEQYQGTPKYGCATSETLEIPTELPDHLKPYADTFTGLSTCDEEVNSLGALLSLNVYGDAIASGNSVQVPMLDGSTGSLATCADIATFDKKAATKQQEDIVDMICVNFYCSDGYKNSYRVDYYKTGDKEDPFSCPDPRALLVPLLYSFFICFTSPCMLIFFREVLGAKHEALITGDEEQESEIAPKDAQMANTV